MGLVLAYKKSTATPQFDGDPSFSGSLLAGQTLTGSYGFTNSVNTVTAAWWSYASIERIDPIERATTAQYTILEADANRYLEFVVTATNNAGQTIAYSGLTPQVLDDTSPVPEFQSGATVAGQPKVGATLTANCVPINADSLAYQWQSSADNVTFANITDATSQTYVLTAGEQDDYVRVIITATNTSGSLPSTSSSVGPIAEAEAELPPPAGAPVNAVPLNAANVASRTLSDGAVLLNGAGAYYYLVGDMTFAGAAFVVNHRNITLDFNGCTVTFNTSGEESWWDRFSDGGTLSGGPARYAANCKRNRNGVWAPTSTTDTAYSGDTTPGGGTVLAIDNRDHGGFVLKNGTLKSNSAAHNTHCVAANNTAEPLTATSTSDWTISNMRLESGTGNHARCVVSQYGQFNFYDAICIQRSSGWWTIGDRHALPAAAGSDKGKVVAERSAFIGGVSGLVCGAGSRIRQNFISNYCFLTNGFSVMSYSTWSIIVEDNVTLPYNGRGIYFDLSSSGCTARNNVMLVWEMQNNEYGDGLTASAFKTRYDSQNHAFYGNHILAVAGRRAGDSYLPTWTGTYPITTTGPAKRASASAIWFEPYGDTRFTPSVAYNNICRSIYYGDRETLKNRVSALTITGGYLESGGVSTGHGSSMYGNTCYSNMAMVCTNEPDGRGQCRATNSGNSFAWETGPEAYTAFTSAADAKLATIAFAPEVLAVVNEQKTLVYASLDDAINQADAGLYTGKAFWQGEYYADAGHDEFVTFTDSSLGSGVTAATRMSLTGNMAHRVAWRTAKTHTLQILDGASPVANATVTVTPDQIDTPYDDVTTTTTDANGNCTITYYEHAYHRPGGATASLTSTSGTSSTVSVSGVGSAVVTHSSLPSTLDLTA